MFISDSASTFWNALAMTYVTAETFLDLPDSVVIFYWTAGNQFITTFATEVLNKFQHQIRRLDQHCKLMVETVTLSICEVILKLTQLQNECWACPDQSSSTKRCDDYNVILKQKF